MIQSQQWNAARSCLLVSKTDNLKSICTVGVYVFSYSYMQHKNMCFRHIWLRVFWHPLVFFCHICVLCRYRRTVVFACLHSKQLKKVSLLSWSHRPHCKSQLSMHAYVWVVTLCMWVRLCHVQLSQLKIRDCKFLSCCHCLQMYRHTYNTGSQQRKPTTGYNQSAKNREVSKDSKILDNRWLETWCLVWLAVRKRGSFLPCINSSGCLLV